MLERFRDVWHDIWTPQARLLLRLGVSPNLVTVLGTLGVVVGALACFPQGMLWQGAAVVAFFVIADTLDGQMARISERPSEFGAFLDSTLDRFGDAAIFGGLVLYYAGPGDSRLYLALSLLNLVMGALTSYTRARAESAGFNGKGGFAERADRLAWILLCVLIADLANVPEVLQIGLWLLAAASTLTVAQRIHSVQRQARAVE